ncbi:hypothetical protein TNCV_2722191 [Trichonephila clavipes]|nr:hypothetical protein TNCV_2722191 [Trichonephila clavipes]
MYHGKGQWSSSPDKSFWLERYLNRNLSVIWFWNYLSMLKNHFVTSSTPRGHVSIERPKIARAVGCYQLDDSRALFTTNIFPHPAKLGELNTNRVRSKTI